MPPSERSLSLGTRIGMAAAFLKAAGSRFVEELAQPQRPRSDLPPPGTLRIWARETTFHLEPHVALHLEDLAADLVAHDPTQALRPGDRESYTFHILSGRIRLAATTVECLVERMLESLEPRPLENVSVELEGRGLKLTGTVRLGPISAPVILAGPLDLAADGRLAFAIRRLEVGGLRVGGLLDLLSGGLERWMKVPPGGAVSVQGQRILLDPAGIVSAPRSRGRVCGLDLGDGELVLTYAGEAPPPPADLSGEETPAAWLHALGHDVHVGRMQMHDTHCQVVPLAPDAAWLDLSLDVLDEQLQAGRSRMIRRGELLVSLPGLDELAEADLGQG
ncbi:MAG: hypothetical protein VKO64_08035 [Candidatus Sericytochromatia bacterium]|nr:hypothetical protein [Candidatus Sericytochromatia bacterium]